MNQMISSDIFLSCLLVSLWFSQLLSKLSWTRVLSSSQFIKMPHLYPVQHLKSVFWLDKYLISWFALISTMFIFIICFTFGPLDLSGDQEAMNIFNFFFFLNRIQKCSVEKERTDGEEDYNYIGASVWVTKWVVSCRLV